MQPFRRGRDRRATRAKEKDAEKAKIGPVGGRSATRKERTKEEREKPAQRTIEDRRFRGDRT